MKTKYQTFEEMFSSPFNFNLGMSNVEQIRTEDGGIMLEIDALGHNPAGIDIDVTSNKLTIKSTKLKDTSNLIKPLNLKYSLGKGIDTDNIDAEFKNGILIITVPIHTDTSDIVRKIKIKN